MEKINNTKAILLSSYRQIHSVIKDVEKLSDTENIISYLNEAIKEIDFKLNRRTIYECETKECEVCKNCNPKIFYLEGEE